MARAMLYGFVGGRSTNAGALPVGAEPTGPDCGVAMPSGTGDFIVDPGANRPGIELQPELVGFIRRMAEFLPRPPIVTTGTNHSPTTTSGNPSDHWTGYGADFGSLRNGFPATGGGYGDRIAEAAFLAAGEPSASARAKAGAGGNHVILRGGLRVQIIWKSFVGGNHYDHIHVDLGQRQQQRPLCPARRRRPPARAARAEALATIRSALPAGSRQPRDPSRRLRPRGG
jgi:hypothetical protein